MDDDIVLEYGVNFGQTLKHKDCLYKYVSVKTVDIISHEGWLKTIDPMTGNLILVSFTDDNVDAVQTVIIMGKACTSVDVLKEADEKMKDRIRNLYGRPTSVPTEETSDRKDRLIAWIKKNRLSVEEVDDSLVIGDEVTIHPPYDSESCMCSNGRILTKVRRLIINLPKEDSTEVPVKTEATGNAPRSTKQ